MSKRCRGSAFDDEPRLRIKLAGTGSPGEQGAAAPAPLEAEAHLVRMFSCVARRLPETDEWDLSGLLVDGQPVSRATVVAWLNAAYQLAYQADFEQQDDNPARSVEGLYRLLAFADAVGTTKGLLQACCSQLERLQLFVELGQQHVELGTDGTGYIFLHEGETSSLYQMHMHEILQKIASVPAAASAEEQQAFKQQVAAQMEQLLWLAYRLQLQPLIQRLHGFVRMQRFFRNSALPAEDNAVFSSRVLEAAGADKLPRGAQLLKNGILGEVLYMADASALAAVAGTQLAPASLTAQQQQPLKFDAVVQHSSLKLPQGATVPVELDLFRTSTIKLGVSLYPVQLRIGSYSGW